MWRETGRLVFDSVIRLFGYLLASISAKICGLNLRQSAGKDAALATVSKFRRFFPQIGADFYADDRRFLP
jgi:hypothetical protein